MNSQGYVYITFRMGRQIVTYIKSPITKTAASNLFDYIEKEALRCNKKERFLHGRFLSRARQRDVLTDRILFEQLKNYFERLTVNG